MKTVSFQLAERVSSRRAAIVVSLSAVTFSALASAGTVSPLLAIAVMAGIGLAAAACRIHALDRRVLSLSQALTDSKRESCALAKSASEAAEAAQAPISWLDLACELDMQVGDDVAQLALATRELELNTAVVSEAILAAHETAEALQGSARSVSNNAQSVAKATDQLATALQTVDSQSSQYGEVLRQAAKNALTTNRTITNLTEASQSISDILDAIGEVARQTNLLALNAAIEAARAGDAGRGFAVVANEVKALSTQTSKATHDARAQILAMQAASREAVEAVAVIADSVGELNELAESVNLAIASQRRMTLDMSSNVVRAAEEFQQVAGRVALLNESNERAAEAAEGALQVARDVTERAGGIQGAIGRFLIAPTARGAAA